MMILKDKFKNTRIVLASKSPRRQFLLGELGLQFEVAATRDVDESFPSHLPKKEIPVYLANKKSEAYADIVDDKTLLITADTIVWCRGKVLDKPADREDAIGILEELSSGRHQVITGVCLRSIARSVSFLSLTSVYFRMLSNEEIVYYVDNYKPYDKAGAYGIQEWIGYAGIEAIKGSYFNVMGLPTEKLYRKLVEF